MPKSCSFRASMPMRTLAMISGRDRQDGLEGQDGRDRQDGSTRDRVLPILPLLPIPSSATPPRIIQMIAPQDVAAVAGVDVGAAREFVGRRDRAANLLPIC